MKYIEIKNREISAVKSKLRLINQIYYVYKISIHGTYLISTAEFLDINENKSQLQILRKNE